MDGIVVPSESASTICRMSARQATGSRVENICTKTRVVWPHLGDEHARVCLKWDCGKTRRKARGNNQEWKRRRRLNYGGVKFLQSSRRGRSVILGLPQPSIHGSFHSFLCLHASPLSVVEAKLVPVNASPASGEVARSFLIPTAHTCTVCTSLHLHPLQGLGCRHQSSTSRAQVEDTHTVLSAP